MIVDFSWPFLLYSMYTDMIYRIHTLVVFRNSEKNPAHSDKKKSPKAFFFSRVVTLVAWIFTRPLALENAACPIGMELGFGMTRLRETWEMTGVEVFWTPTPLWFYFESEGWMNATWVFWKLSWAFLFGKFEVQQHPVGLSACSSQSSTNTVGLVHPWAGVVKWPTSVVKKHPNHRFSLSEIMFFFCIFSRNSQVHYLTTLQFERCLFQISAGWNVYRSDRILLVPELGFVGYISVKCWDSFFTVEQFFFGAWDDGSCDRHFPWSWVIGTAFFHLETCGFVVLQDISCFNGICSIPDLGLESEEVVISAESGQLDESFPVVAALKMKDWTAITQGKMRCT